MISMSDDAMPKTYTSSSTATTTAAAAAVAAWLHLIMLLLLVTTTTVATTASGGDGDHGRRRQQLMMGLPGCITRCGNVSVPYPFGIEPGCYLKGFKVTCNATGFASPRPVFWLGADQYVVTGIWLSNSTMRFRPRRVVMAPSLGPGPAGTNWTGDENSTGCHFFSDQLNLNWEVGSKALAGRSRHASLPGNETCPKDLGSDACHSRFSTCRNSNTTFRWFHHTTGYVCTCHHGFQGNPYLPDGCKDIDECKIPDKCFGNCTNLPGSYLCQCPKGTRGNPTVQNGCISPPDQNTGLIIGLGAGSGAMVIFLVIGMTLIIRKIKTRRKKNMRRKFFDQNHGQLLHQLLPLTTGIAETMIVITLEELEKATNNFDKARELGGGGHGTVYKGILSSLHVVAIKKSKIVIQKEIDEFINEVAILSQINHRNIVKLQGCCLETEVPLLVYEFISNGTLYNHLHVENSISLSWRDRLRIAVEIARALTYLHSLTSMPIIHRDVKSPNILLDDNLTAKLSDFGASRYIHIDQSGLNTTVQGTFGYLDPTYHSTGHLTEKSDVYSFGVLLIELLTRKKPVSYRSIEGHSLVYCFVTLISKGSLFQILDAQVAKEGDGEVIDIALLAAICVKHESKDRPTMRQVEMTLESIYAAKEYVSSDMTDDRWSEEMTNVDITIHRSQD